MDPVDPDIRSAALKITCSHLKYLSPKTETFEFLDDEIPKHINQQIWICRYNDA